MAGDKDTPPKSSGASRSGAGATGYSGWILGGLVGLAIGVSLGVAMANIPVGVIFGIGIGIAFGLAFTRSKNAQESRSRADRDEQH
jgi:ABC-type antimicrobial peptide transport system permease subunit